MEYRGVDPKQRDLGISDRLRAELRRVESVSDAEKLGAPANADRATLERAFAAHVHNLRPAVFVSFGDETRALADSLRRVVQEAAKRLALPPAEEIVLASLRTLRTRAESAEEQLAAGRERQVRLVEYARSVEQRAQAAEGMLATAWERVQAAEQMSAWYAQANAELRELVLRLESELARLREGARPPAATSVASDAPSQP